MGPLLMECMANRRVALCIPWNGEAIPLIYWYGVLAAIGIFVGTFLASKHIEKEGEDPNVIWDALLWLLIPAMIGARLWYVLAEVIGGSDYYSLARPLQMINPRDGGMNIFGGAVFGLIAMIIYARRTKAKGWLLTDAALLGLLVGQGIGRFGNFINIELYGPPTNSGWFGMFVPEVYRMVQFRGLPETTRFHPTMLYEAFWLFLVAGVLWYLFDRYQDRFITGAITGFYLLFNGLGRFILEVAGLRPDQPLLTTTQGGVPISVSIVLAMFYVVIGLIIVLDRYNYLRIPTIDRPQTLKQREESHKSLVRARERAEREREKAKQREERRRRRRQVAGEADSDASGEDDDLASDGTSE